MRKNVFLKSTLRQWARTAVLVLLIAGAAFGFVMRTTEYLTISTQINDIARHYRSIGFLTPHHRVVPVPPLSGDLQRNVAAAAELISQSPYVDVMDARRTAMGFLADMQNSNFRPERVRRTYPDEGSLYTFFYGSLYHINPRAHVLPGFAGRSEAAYMGISVDVEGVLAGFPEFAYVGTRARLLINTDFAFMFEGLVIGERYLFRASEFRTGERPSPRYLRLAPMDINPGTLDRIGWAVDVTGLDWEEAEAARREVEIEILPNHIWYMHLPAGQSPDLSVIDGLEENIERLNRDQSEVMLVSTKDMSALPWAQPGGMMTLAEGRWLDYDDYLNANPVVVVHRHFAGFRNISVGDTIVVDVPNVQRNLGSRNLGRHEMHIVTVDGLTGDRISEEYIEGYTFMTLDAVAARHYPATRLELEVVGIYALRLPWQGGGGFFQLPVGTEFGTFMYVPDSLPMPVTYAYTPDDLYERLVLRRAHSTDMEDFDALLAEWTREHEQRDGQILDFAFSFIIGDPRNVPAFMLANRAALDAMGWTVTFFETGAEEFWAGADPILLTTTVNLFVFWGVLVLVLALAVFLLLRQRRKDYAISRSLGSSNKKLLGHLTVTAVVLGMPAIVAAGFAGWYFALSRAAETLAGAFDQYFEITLTMYWLFLMFAAVMILMLIPLVLGAIRLACRPVLELLQGSRSRNNRG